LRIAVAEPWRREHVFDLGDRLRSGLAAIGLATLSPSGPIAPVVVGEADRAVALAGRLLGAGFLVPAIRPPTVPSGTSRLRVSLTAAHDAATVDELVGALAAGPA